MTETTAPKIGAVILAAGPSRRMGTPKLAIVYRGVPLLRLAVDAALGAGCDDVVVVLGADAEQYRPLLDGAPVRIVHNPYYAEGMSGSIQIGIEVLSEDTRAAVVMLADQAFIDAAIIRTMIQTYRTSGKQIVACQYGEVRGAPALFDRAMFLELLLLTGDQGARTVMETYPAHVATVTIPVDTAKDIDTPEDARLLVEDT